MYLQISQKARRDFDSISCIAENTVCLESRHVKDIFVEMYNVHVGPTSRF